MMRLTKILLATALVVSTGACTNDDAESLTTGSQTIVVESEELVDENGTRSAYNPNGNSVHWQEGDQLGVYDQNLLAYDQYVFRSASAGGTGLFTCNADQSWITGPITYALFPFNEYDLCGWTNTGIKLLKEIPSTIVCDATTEDKTTVPGQTLYAGNLPMWGLASGTFGNVSAYMKHLTAALKLNLQGVQGKATFVKVSSSKPLSGSFEAVIASASRVPDLDAQMHTVSSAKTQNYIIVDVRKVPSSSMYVYVPVIADAYEDLQISYINEPFDGVTLPETTISGADGTEWKKIKTYEAGKEFKRNTAYVVNWTF